MVTVKGVSIYSMHPPPFQTDDKGIFTTSLTEEFCIAAESFSLSHSDLWRLSVGAVGAIFEEGLVGQLKSCLKSHEKAVLG